MEKRGDSDSSVVEQNFHLAEYLRHLKTRRYSDRTLDVYERVIRDFAGFAGEIGRRSAVEITDKDLVDYRLSMLRRGFRDNSVVVYLRAVKQLFGWLEEQQHIFVNPTANQPIFRTRRSLIPVPTQEEMRILLEQPDTSTPRGVRDRAILETAYSTGLRRHELASLTLDSVNLANGTIRVMGKGEKERVVPLGSRADEWLRRYIREVRPRLLDGSETDALWISSWNRPLGDGGIHAVLRQCRKAEGIKTHISLHGIRRACASHMVQNGADPMSVQLLLGHGTLRHLNAYLRLCVADMKAMHEKSRLGQ